MRLYIPRAFTFPYGYKVKIRLVSPAQIKKVAGDCVGAWREDLRTIYINKDQSKPEQIATLFHELVHAQVDASNWVQGQMGLELKKN